MELFLKGGAQPRALPSHIRSVDGLGTALYEAVSAAQIPVAKLLLDWEDANELSPQAPGNNAVLIVAAQNGHEEIVRRMVEHSSVNIDGRNEKKQNALGLAAENGHADIVRLLLDHGANAAAESGDALPIILALLGNHLSVAKILSAHGNFDVKKVYHAQHLYSQWCDFTPLYHSIHRVEGVSIEMVKHLIDLGARPNSNGEKPYPLQAAVSSRWKQCEQVVSLLLEHGADPNLSDGFGLPPLHEAAYLGSANMVTWLLEHGADPNLRGYRN